MPSCGKSCAVGARVSVSTERWGDRSLLRIARGHDVRHFETKDLETILSEDARQVRGEIVGQF